MIIQFDPGGKLWQVIRWGIAVIVVVGVTAAVVRACNDNTPKVIYKPKVVKDTAMERKNRELEAKLKQRDKDVDSLKQEIAGSNKVIAKANKEITRLIYIHKNIKAPTDSTCMLAYDSLKENTDALVVQVEHLQAEIAYRDTVNAELTWQMEDALETSNVIIENQNKDIKRLQASLTDCNEEATKMATDANKKEKKRKWKGVGRTLVQIGKEVGIFFGGVLVGKIVK